MKSILIGLLASAVALSPMPAQQKTPVKDTVVSTVTTATKWVGLGKEVGEAVNSSLDAVTTNTAKFADTKVGKMTMFIVAWKVLGRDILGLVWGIIIIGIGIPIVTWSYSRYLPKKFLSKETHDPTTGKIISREYKSSIDDEDEERREEKYTVSICHGLAYLVILGASSCALFGGPKP